MQKPKQRENLLKTKIIKAYYLQRSNNKSGNLLLKRYSERKRPKKIMTCWKLLWMGVSADLEFYNQWKYSSKMKIFSESQNLRKIFTSIPVLLELLKGVLQAGENYS